MKKRNIQTNLNNEKIPENQCRCIKSMNDYYLVVPKPYKLHNLYKMQKIGTTLVFHPVIDSGIITGGK